MAPLAIVLSVVFWSKFRAWDKEALNAYEEHNDFTSNYVKDGETPGYVEAHKKCLAKLGVELFWNINKRQYEIKEKIK